MVVAIRAEALITAQNRLRPGLSAAARDLDRFRGQQSKAMTAFGSAQARILAGVGTALAGFSATRALNDATRRFAEVDRAMTRTGITGDATVRQTREGALELRNLARDTATLFDPAQKGLDAITASGRDFTEAMRMMPSVLRTAQASGAGVEEIANSSTALLDHMKISVEGLAAAQDTLAMGGKLGKFELKDMARYLPSMLPAFKALGQTGQDGLRSLVAMLQVIRGGTGTAEEAASSAQNIFSKMESEQTVKNFKDMGVDLPKAMTKARKEGRNLMEVFVELSNKALKGDLSKVPQLFKDMEVQRGMRPLLADFQKYLDYRDKLKGSAGTIDADFKRVSVDAKANLDRFSEAADRTQTAIGGIAAELSADNMKRGAANLDAVAQAMERAAEAARSEGFMGAVKSLGGALAASIGKDVREGPGLAEMQAAADDASVAQAVATRAKSVNEPIRDPRVIANLRGEIASLEARPPSPRIRERIAELRARLGKGVESLPVSSGELAAISRDQQRRQDLPSLKLDMTSAAPEFDAAREAVREARRASAFGRTQRPDNAVPGVSAPGAVLPPPRPVSFKGAIDIPVQPLDEVQGKVSAVATSFDLLGPAAQTAGAAISSGLGAGEGAIDRAIAKAQRLQAILNGLRVPPLGGGGAGGFDTGKQGPN